MKFKTFRRLESSIQKFKFFKLELMQQNLKCDLVEFKIFEFGQIYHK